MCKATLSFLVLLSCLGQSGCEQKQTVETSAKPPTHDSAGYLIQPHEDFLVGGQRPGWMKNFFIQIEVDGHDERPFVLTIGDTALSHDNWPLAPETKPNKQTSSGFFFSRIEPPTPRAIAGASLNSEELTMLAQAVQKYFVWSDTAAKENLNVESKELLSLTNWHLTVTFSRPKESSNSFINVEMLTEPWPPPGSLPSYCSIKLDKLGIDRLLSVISNLPIRREKFIAFRDEQNKISRQRREAEQNEKARADKLLH